MARMTCPRTVRRVNAIWRALVSIGGVLAAVLGFRSAAQVPEWIWYGNTPAQANAVVFFRRQFSVGFQAQRAELIAGGDDEVTVYLNGVEAGHSTDWKKPLKLEVTGALREGTNVLALRGRNGATGPAAVFAKLEVRSPNNFGVYIVTDNEWMSSAVETRGWEATGFAPDNWKPAVSLGKMGVAPWGDVLGAPRATPAESLAVLPGFKAELLKSADTGEGSWICMTTDDRGRLIISPEKDEAPLLRVTLDADGAVAKTERIPAPVRGAMGLCYAHNSLYVNGRGPRGVGLYRLVDANHNDQFEAGEEHLLKNFEGDNEHGYHAVVPGPDGMIYVMNGNHTKVPPGMAADSPHRNYAEDLLLARQWDPNGHAKGVLAPGGYVLRTDPEGRDWSLICGGFRNTYDLDFNTDGELFTFDSDMEWDIGAPWYRPTRINHCVSGGEYGWRSGSGKWPVYYPDSLPGNLDVGLSSPTGVKFGTKSRFPPRYRQALFACDWNYGKIFAVHLQPQGASYSGTFETFVSGRPLNVTSLAFGRDGAMYFIIGGWKTQSGLYRISYVGPPHSEPPPTAAELARARTAAGQRAIRHRLESFHGRKNPAAVDFAWPYLDSPDRWLRYAARLAIESQDLSFWQRRALEETRVNASLTALLALARCAGREVQQPLLESLGRLADEELTEAQSLEALRVLQLCFIRMGGIDTDTREDVVKVLSRFYSARTGNLNRELCQLLAYLEAPDVIGKTLALMATAPNQDDQMYYAFALRNVKAGWTPEQRRIYFSWFNKALREYQGGNSFAKYLVNIRKDALDTLTESESAALASIVENRAASAPPAGAPRPLVKEWTLAELEPALRESVGGRSFAQGREAFAAAKCAACHRMGNEGGSVGPDLTGVSGRFNRRDLLENILVPSKVISDRYRTFTITRRDGEELSGSIIEETDERIVLLVNPLTQQREEVPKKDIQSRAVSELSQMPEGLLNVLTVEEVLDLLAYLEADGKPDHAAFAGAK